jgi:hypothetical protein
MFLGFLSGNRQMREFATLLVTTALFNKFSNNHPIVHRYVYPYIYVYIYIYIPLSLDTLTYEFVLPVPQK